ncbi:MAG: sigma-54 dependent transcriptional regulator [Spirochaetia bacterium]|jgi:two-component system nitrogen regulation response regulator NtrX|nr:sigma-54 dependent transcriptional regulator [Spirochaetia bacterium]
MSKILIIDDEPGIRTVLSDIIRDENHHVFAAGDGFEGLSILKSESIDLVILDVWLPNMGGIDVLKEIKKEYPNIEVIMISGHANIDIAVKAVKLGAYDFLEKPLSLDKIINLIKNALKMEELKKENVNLKNATFMEDEMIGSSDYMNAIWTRIKQSAPTDAKILITGDNGTGKELIAREIHKNSNKSTGPFIEVNCAAIPDTLIESELFGHEKGAFTSAVARRKGKFEMAHGGTLFLDEIADMSMNAQAKVLRAIQELKFERIGSENSITVDTRLITATNKDIANEVKAGRFREDLFYRLNVVPIHVPSLKERKSDIEELIYYFIEKFRSKNNAANKTISREGLDILQNYNWPGNIRELKNFIERINIMTDEKEISAETVKYYIQEDTNTSTIKDNEYTNLKLNEAKDKFEKQFLIQKLEENSYNISRAAETMGIYPSNLHGKIKKFGIEIIK